MTTETALIYEVALGEGDQYAALLASILNGAGPALPDVGEDDDDFVIEEPDF